MNFASDFYKNLFPPTLHELDQDGVCEKDTRKKTHDAAMSLVIKALRVIRFRNEI